jgi:hypothetical protein
VALLIDAAYELFGFLRRPRIDMAQQTIQRKLLIPEQIGQILHGLRRQMIDLDPYSNPGWVATKD